MSTALAVYHGDFGRAVLYQLNRSMVTHAHREGHLLFYVQGPHSSLKVSETVCPLDNGRAVAVNPWQPHNYIAAEEGRSSMILVLYIKPAWFLEIGRHAQFALRFGRSQIEVTGHIARLLQMIAGLLLEEAETELFEGYLYELTQECFDQTWQWTPGPCEPVTAQTVVRDFRIRNSLRIMAGRLGDGDAIILNRIARESGLSRPHFYKLFRQNLGLTPNIYLNTLRMESAIDRLTLTDDPVTAIGLDLGYSSQASFSRFFVSNVGIAPTDYRRVAHFAARGA